MKINLGCGQDWIEGYLNLDKNPANDKVQKVESYKDLGLEEESVEEVRALYVLASTPVYEVLNMLEYWFKLLKSGGEMYIELPDLSLIANDITFNYINIEQMNQLLYANGRCSGFTLTTFEPLLQSIGFKTKDKGLIEHSFYIRVVK